MSGWMNEARIINARKQKKIMTEKKCIPTGIILYMKRCWYRIFEIMINGTPLWPIIVSFSSLKWKLRFEFADEQALFECDTISFCLSINIWNKKNVKRKTSSGTFELELVQRWNDWREICHLPFGILDFRHSVSSSPEVYFQLKWYVSVFLSFPEI